MYNYVVLKSKGQRASVARYEDEVAFRAVDYIVFISGKEEEFESLHALSFFLPFPLLVVFPLSLILLNA